MKSKDTKQVSSIEFKTIVRKSGGSGHIIVPSSLIGKNVQVNIEVID